MPTAATTIDVTTAEDVPVESSGTALDAKTDWGHELALSAELAALAVFALSRPVLSSFGKSPESFIVEGASGRVVVAFGVAVTLVPAIVVGAVGVAARRAPGRARPLAQPALVGILGGVVVWRVGQEVMGWPGNATKLLLAGPLAAVLFFVVRRATNDESGREAEVNLFTLLGGSYDMHVREQVTRLCPAEACPQPEPGGLGPLLGEAVDLWAGGVVARDAETNFDLPALLAGRVYADAEERIESVDLQPGGRPDLVFQHIILPHEPWRTTDDGTFYDGDNPPTGSYATGPDDRLINAIVPPRLFVEGGNDLAAHLVEGDPGHETLRRLAIDSG